MFKLIIVAVALAMTGCAGTGERSALDRIEFDDDEYGCARISGTVDTSASVFASANVTVNVVKKKDHPDGGATPDC